jgi:hypothetical protein
MLQPRRQPSSERKRSLGRYRRRWENNIKMVLREIEWESACNFFYGEPEGNTLFGRPRPR